MLLLLLTVNALAAEELTLQDALQEALAGNLELQQAGMTLQQARSAVQQSRGAFDPTVSVSTTTRASSSPSNNTLDNVSVVNTSAVDVSAGLSQQLPTGGRVQLSWSESVITSNAESQVSDSFYSDSAWLVVSQPLLSGAWLAARASVRGAMLSLGQQELRYRLSVEQLVLMVSEAYWELLAARERLRLAEESERNAEQQFNNVQERFEEGFAGTYEVLQFQRSLGVARQVTVIGRASARAAENRLSRLLGRPLQDAVAIQLVDRPQLIEGVADVQVSLAHARKGNSAWLIEQLSAEQAELNHSAARINTLPDLSVSSQLGLSGGATELASSRQQITDQTNPLWSLSGNFQVAIPARTARATRSQAGLSAEQARLALVAAEQDLIASVDRAVQSLERDQLRNQLSQQTLEAAQLSVDAEQERYREGKATAQQVVITVEALNEAQSSMLEAEIDLQASQLSLLQLEGRLLSSQGITPPEW